MVKDPGKIKWKIDEAILAIESVDYKMNLLLVIFLQIG